MRKAEIEQLLMPTIADMGYILWGCEYHAQGKHSLLRIYIDKESGIGIEDCERVSRQVSAILDVEDPIRDHYSLEVSSPGIPRPIFYNWQYERYIGKNIRIKLYSPLMGKRVFIGTIASANENELVLEMDGTEQHFLFSTIAKANLSE